MAIYGTLGGQDSTTTGYPSIQPALDLNFAQTKLLDPRVTFYRDSFATYTDSQGIIRTAPANVPRFEHDPATGESLGLLIEDSRTNYVFGTGGSALYASYNFSAESIWTITPISSDVLAPDGSAFTTKAAAGATGNTYFWRYANTFTHAANTTYTQSVWIRVASGSASITLSAFPYSQNSYINTITTQWQRKFVTYTTENSGTVPYMGIVAPTANTTYYLWGWQIEQGGFPTSYIPTTTSTVTRREDTAYIDGTNFSSWYNPTEGTLFSMYRSGYYSSEVPVGLTLSSSEINNVIALGSSSSGPLPGAVQTFAIVNSGVTQTGLSGSTIPTDNELTKTAGAYKLNDIGFSTKGEIYTDNSATIPTVDLLRIGKYPYYGIWHNRPIARIMYYARRLPNDQLKNLTAL